MSFEEQAATLNRKDVAALLATLQQLKTSFAELVARNDALAYQIEWFKRQMFGSKSERRPGEPDGRQQFLGEWTQDPSAAAGSTVAIAAHQRRRGTTEQEDDADEGGLRFDESVPVEEIRIPSLKPVDDEHEVISEKTTYRLAQRPGSYVILKYVREVIKRREDGTLSCPPAPASVLGKSCADVSFLAGLLLDKFRFHRVPRRHAQHPKGRRSKPCCMEDEGRPLGIGVQAQVPNHFELLVSRVRVVNVEGKGAA